jgi:hypothetical protein
VVIDLLELDGLGASLSLRCPVLLTLLVVVRRSMTSEGQRLRSLEGRAKRLEQGGSLEACSLRELRKLLKTSGTRVDLECCRHGDTSGEGSGRFWRIRECQSPRMPCTRPA